ncbi:hypothetical protein PSE10B_57060 [Pseudomonas amygdali pv. eriobotryae]|uniref:Uncharacterized protein n=1 Tax=Pseudomonas amygdali pv. eriobotryae TaxID=129137 RepID=A0A9P3EFD8_PSEA0|nr:hypothetical protein PSE10A_58340 [Pseudomonas amygdali pv. eriobotryae]GFZ69184.1 hypothetical protein PSE10B_57060 [Pseudomonas amygdali pv. eriobotryae]
MTSTLACSEAVPAAPACAENSRGVHSMTAVKQICMLENAGLIAGSLIFTSRALEAVGIYVHSMTKGSV